MQEEFYFLNYHIIILKISNFKFKKITWQSSDQEYTTHYQKKKIFKGNIPWESLASHCTYFTKTLNQLS